MKGSRGELIPSIDFNDGTDISPRLDFTKIILSSLLIEVIVTLLLMEQSIAFIP